MIGGGGVGHEQARTHALAQADMQHAGLARLRSAPSPRPALPVPTGWSSGSRWRTGRPPRCTSIRAVPWAGSRAIPASPAVTRAAARTARRCADRYGHRSRRRSCPGPRGTAANCRSCSG
ncbi:hypothetical protein G6F32_015248 [Rhizopus arrhizus]|nr:hypothetical protein G6F32_015248 [Rhizopus arrhizus]